MNARIILASGSKIRASLMRAAGLQFEVIRPGVNEDEIKTAAKSEGLTLEATAARLADAKCLAVAKKEKAIVIASDQIMEFEGRAFDKPKSMAEARDRLLDMRGKTHSLLNAVSVAENGELIWRHLDRPELSMRHFSETELDSYLEEAGDGILASVGAYEIERLGIRLFKSIEGDQFAIQGLSMTPLLAVLREKGAIKF